MQARGSAVGAAPCCAALRCVKLCCEGVRLALLCRSQAASPPQSPFHPPPAVWRLHLPAVRVAGKPGGAWPACAGACCARHPEHAAPCPVTIALTLPTLPPPLPPAPTPQGAYLLSFGSAVDAVRFCHSAQALLLYSQWPTDCADYCGKTGGNGWDAGCMR